MIEALVKQRALEIGFDLVGIAPIAAAEALKFSREWVERGYGGEMRYLANPKRGDPRRILPSARSVICVGLTYNSDFPYSTEVRNQESEVRSKKPKSTLCGGADGGLRTTDNGLEGESPRAWISRYAWGTDYHQIMRAKLEQLRAAVKALSPAVETRVYVDTGPIVERAFARLAGIGWVGKNTCLINESKGSWFFLGVMLTDLALGPDLAAPDRCGSCTACIDACPTDALVQPYVMDASRCISYLTIELKGAIPPEFRSAIGANVVGCDICQDVCPWNSRGSRQLPVVSGQFRNSNPPSVVRSQRHRPATSDHTEFQPLQVNLERDGQHAESRNLNREPRDFSLFNPPLEALAAMDEEDFRRIFRHSPVKRVKYRGWLRNLCVAMGNSDDTRFVPQLESLCEHSDPLVREHAAWAIAQLTTDQRVATAVASSRAAS